MAPPRAPPRAPLLASRRFLPLFATQMLGALNDNLFKNAVVVLILFKGSGNALLIPLAGAIFILPYALFSATAGQLADRMGKAGLIRLTKLYEVALMLLASIGFLTGSEAFLLLVLFGLGVQATFFGPLKYGILSELVAPGELVAANGLIEASTFIGILIGTILGAELMLLDGGRWIASAAALLVAASGWLAARQVPQTEPASPGLVVERRILAETWRLLGEARDQRVVWACILALSWFWSLGAVFLAAFPVIVKQGFGAGGQVVTLMLSIFSIGVGAGSLLAAGLLRGRISASPVVPAAVVLTLATLDFAWATGHVTPATGWSGIGPMLSHAEGWRVLLDLFVVAASGGVYSVPLYALLQDRAAAAWRARMIGANNIMNAVFIVAGAVVLSVGSALHVPVAWVLAGFGVATGAVVLAIRRAGLP